VAVLYTGFWPGRLLVQVICHRLIPFMDKTSTHLLLLAAALLGTAHHPWGLLECKHKTKGRNEFLLKTIFDID